MLDNSPTVPMAEQAMLPEGESPLPTPRDNDELKQYEVTEPEALALDALKKDLTMYALQKNSSGNSDFLGLKNYMQAMRPKVVSKSNVVYWQVLDAPSENKDTIISIIQDLHQRFIIGQKRTHVIVEGDANLYEIFQSLKLEYRDELKWLLIYPGDWHLLKNYQIAYFEPGLKELAKACKYPLAAIKSCSQFKRSPTSYLKHGRVSIV